MCYCDELCGDYGDCCADMCIWCPDLAPQCLDSCRGSCGGESLLGDCWCDEECWERGDCCSDVCKLCGCDLTSQTASPSPTQSLQTPVDPGASCQYSCGESAPDGDCYCDETCIYFGDCCVDACEWCPMLPQCLITCLPNSCQDHCGVGAEGGVCWCDDECTNYGDCCADSCDFCPELTHCAPDWNSCEERCSSEALSGECWCDLYCANWGDCCTDVCEWCPLTLHCLSSSCEGQCGGVALSQECYCDTECMDWGDCCEDMCDFCLEDPNCITTPTLDPSALVSSSCEGRCGTYALSELCWCDDYCDEYGDCCEDFCELCGAFSLFCFPEATPTATWSSTKVGSSTQTIAFSSSSPTLTPSISTPTRGATMSSTKVGSSTQTIAFSSSSPTLTPSISTPTRGASMSSTEVGSFNPTMAFQSSSPATTPTRSTVTIGATMSLNQAGSNMPTASSSSTPILTSSLTPTRETETSHPDATSTTNVMNLQPTEISTEPSTYSGRAPNNAGYVVSFTLSVEEEKEVENSTLLEMKTGIAALYSVAVEAVTLVVSHSRKVQSLGDRRLLSLSIEVIISGLSSSKAEGVVSAVSSTVSDGSLVSVLEETGLEVSTVVASPVTVIANEDDPAITQTEVPSTEASGVVVSETSLPTPSPSGVEHIANDQPLLHDNLQTAQASGFPDMALALTLLVPAVILGVIFCWCICHHRRAKFKVLPVENDFSTGLSNTNGLEFGCKTRICAALVEENHKSGCQCPPSHYRMSSSDNNAANHMNVCEGQSDEEIEYEDAIYPINPETFDGGVDEIVYSQTDCLEAGCTERNSSVSFKDWSQHSCQYYTSVEGRLFKNTPQVAPEVSGQGKNEEAICEEGETISIHQDVKLQDESFVSMNEFEEEDFFFMEACTQQMQHV